MKYQTVAEIIEKFGLEDFDKWYRDVDGRWYNTPKPPYEPIIDLNNMLVKNIFINLLKKEATFTIITR